uniref:Cadherin domain-containing protein n=1 Tax=Echeneis naucrates TaxID=173247 RepID=A0A665VQF4_ECHNA
IGAFIFFSLPGDNAELQVVAGDEGTEFFINSVGSLCLNKESVSIPEDTVLHSAVMTVHAEDGDTGSNGEVLYDLKSTSGGTFSINPRSGIIYLEKTLNREEVDTLTISITATDKGSPRMETTMNLTVHVEDANDHDPEFSQSTYSLTVREDIPRGTSLLLVQAHDQDIGPNGQVRYFLTQASPFTMDSVRGVITVMDKLDRERQSMHNLKIIVLDQGNTPRSATHPIEPLSSSVLVTVLIGDVNDHWPQFMNSPYVAYVPTKMDPGSVVCAVRATDEDSEMNAELHYLLYGQNSDLFSINPYSGTVITSGALWRTEDIIINIRVEDAGENPKFDITTMSIRFQNVSNFPEMNVDVLSYSLPEDELVGTLVAVVSSVSVRAEPVSFYLASGNFEEMFHVEQLTGALTVENTLDYESKKEFTLLVEARDSGLPPFSSFAEIHINISDVNDNIPRFTQVEYRCEIFENSPPSWVCDVLAIDADSASYGTVQYNITGGNADHFFTIDPENGVLSTTTSLDRENSPEFILFVEAVELLNPLHKDGKTVTIVVLDRNDNVPRFSQIFFTEVAEDAPVGYTVIHVTATDDDASPNSFINYSKFDQSDNLPFNIDFTTGYITVKRPLDREMQDNYVLKVIANDSAWSIATDVALLITDVNDNRPVFSDNFYNIVLPETKDKDVFVVQVQAEDLDSGQNSEILYVIEPPNEEFWVNSLTLHSPVFEIYQFTVIAFDCGSISLRSNVTVTVRLDPYNHYPPMFLPSQPLIAIPHHMAVGTEVVQFTAIDLDVNNSSANIEYSLNGGNGSD